MIPDSAPFPSFFPLEPSPTLSTDIPVVPTSAPCPSVAHFEPPAPPRRSTRSHSTPKHSQQFVCDLPPSLCGSSLVSSCSNHFTTNATTEPHSYKQAACIPAWQEAMTKEFEALQANNTWSVVPLPSGKKPIHCK